MKTFLNKQVLHTPVALTVEKKELFIDLPYLGNLCFDIRTRLQNSINKNLPFCYFCFFVIFIFKSMLFLSPRQVLAIFSVLKMKCLLTYALM